ncbi:MAG: DUF4172 domain-containing protein [Albidovulum sp.]|nr:DUF4172 domain-containing protein [Albidovulum sp.]
MFAAIKTDIHRIGSGEYAIYSTAAKLAGFHLGRNLTDTKTANIRYAQGRSVGRMQALGFEFRKEASLSVLSENLVKSSAIDGEHPGMAEVRSSVARHIGLDFGGLVPASRDADGNVEMMLDATRNFTLTLTLERLFDWHAALFPTGRSGMRRITVGAGLRAPANLPRRRPSPEALARDGLGCAARQRLIDLIRQPGGLRIYSRRPAIEAILDGKGSLHPARLPRLPDFRPCAFEYCRLHFVGSPGARTSVNRHRPSGGKEALGNSARPANQIHASVPFRRSVRSLTLRS